MVRWRMPKINFRAYRKARFLQACFNEWGFTPARAGTLYVRDRCPLCCDDGKPGRCFAYAFPSCSFYCHKCKAKGDALELVRLKLRCTVVEAAKWLEQKAGPAGSGLIPSSETASR